MKLFDKKELKKMSVREINILSKKLKKEVKKDLTRFFDGKSKNGL